MYLYFQPSQNGKLQTVNTSFILVLRTSLWFQSIGTVTKILKMYTFFKIEPWWVLQFLKDNFFGTPCIYLLVFHLLWMILWRSFSLFVCWVGRSKSYFFHINPTVGCWYLSCKLFCYWTNFFYKLFVFTLFRLIQFFYCLIFKLFAFQLFVSLFYFRYKYSWFRYNQMQ